MNRFLFLISILFHLFLSSTVLANPTFGTFSGLMFAGGGFKFKQVFTSTGALQTFTVPVGCNLIKVKIWGAGGAGGLLTLKGAAGGFTTGFMNVTPGQVLYLIVGGAGTFYIPSGKGGGGFGGGGNAGSSGGGGTGGGGGYSGIFSNSSIIQANALLIAGGGGGGGWTDGGTPIGTDGGPGGGLSGVASPNLGTWYGIGGGGGTALAGGASGGGTAIAGSAFQGGYGSPNADGGGGGGGYFGGGGGYYNGGGGGGSAYIAAGIVDGFSYAGSAQTPPNISDALYVNGVGRGGASQSSGGNGLIIILW